MKRRESITLLGGAAAWPRRRDGQGRLPESRFITADQEIAVSFSNTSISQAAVCRIANRCASLERRKVVLSNVNARV